MDGQKRVWKWGPLVYSSVAAIAAFLLLHFTTDYIDVIQFVGNVAVAVIIFPTTWALLTLYSIIRHRASYSVRSRRVLGGIAGFILALWVILPSLGYLRAWHNKQARQSSDENFLRKMYTWTKVLNPYDIAGFATNPATPPDILIELSEQENPPFGLGKNPNTPLPALQSLIRRCEKMSGSAFCNFTIKDICDRQDFDQETMELVKRTRYGCY